MKLRHGLYPRFLLLAAGVLVVVLAVVGVMLHRQATMQRDVVTLSQESIHGLLFDRVRNRIIPTPEASMSTKNCGLSW